MDRKMRSTVVLLVTIMCAVATGSLAAIAEAVPRAIFWVAGSMSTIERAIAEKERIEARTGMHVMVVPASVKGDRLYRLVVRAADTPANRSLQERNLRFLGVGEPWLINLDLPLAEAAPGGEEEAAAATLEPPETPVQVAAAGPTTEPAPAIATDATPVEPAPGAQPREAPAPMQANADRIFQAGRRSYDEHAYGSAIARFDEALASGGDDARLYYYRAESYSRLGQYESAIADFDKAIAIDPNFSDAYNRRGFAYQMQGDRERALQDYKKALQLDPSNSGAMFNRARMLLIQIAPVLLILVLS